MENKYLNILAPIKLKNTVLKSRLLYPNAMPHFLQGPESYPGESYIDYYSNLAKNGAGLIYFHNLNNPYQRESPSYDARHFAIFDYSDTLVQNYVSQMTDAVHFYGAKMVLPLTDDPVDGVHYAVKARPASMFMGPTEVARLEARGEKLEDYMERFGSPERVAFTEETMRRYIEVQTENALFFKNLGFDGMTVSLSRGTLGEFLDPGINDRTDMYGGCFENRLRFPHELLSAVRHAVGKEFMLILEVSAITEKQTTGGPPADLGLDIDILNALGEFFDLIHLRGHAEVAYSTTGWNSKPGKPAILSECRRLKKLGVKIPIAGGVGFQGLDDMSEALEVGDLDLISVGRLFIANPDLGKLAEEGRADDVVPCLRCNKCHGANLTGPWVNICSVNPKLGLGVSLKNAEKAAVSPKKLGIIGGGPAGLAAAVMAARRGHSVTLFEAGDRLGGQLISAEKPYFKWPVKRYLEWLVYQTEKYGVKTRLNTRVEPEEVKAMGFDAVFAATGAHPVLPPLPGVEGANVMTPYAVYGNEDKVGKRVFVIGGSDTAGETAIYLADLGREVTEITRRDEMFHDSTPIHYLEFVLQKCRELGDALRLYVKSNVAEIGEGFVRWTDGTGTEHITECDTVVAAGGMEPNAEEAIAFAGTAPHFVMLGDCRSVGNIHDAVRAAYAAVIGL